MKKILRGRLALLMAALVAVITLSCGSIMVSQAETVTYGTVSAATAKVRSETNTSSSVVGSLKQGNQVQILQEVTDDSGQTWYKVNVVGGTGYIRGDLVSKGETTDTGTTAAAAATQTPAATTTTTPTTSSAAELPETEVTAMDSQAGTVSTARANVRSGAGKDYSVVEGVSNGDALTVTGTATGTDSKQWYYVTLSSGSQGFIRADLVALGAAASTDTSATAASSASASAASSADSAASASTSAATAATTAAAATNTITATTSSDKYYVYIDGDGVYQLVDNSGASAVQYTVEGVLQANTYVQTHGTGSGLLNWLTIVLGIFVLALAILAVILFLRLRELLYYDDEGAGYDEEEAAEVGEEEPQQPRRGGLFSHFGKKKDAYEEDYPEDEPLPEDEMLPEEEPEEEPRRNGRSAKTAVNRSRSARDDEREEPRDRRSRDDYRGRDLYEEDEDNRSDQSKLERTSKPTPRKSRNFADDDDFEFEFLDLDKDEDKKR